MPGLKPSEEVIAASFAVASVLAVFAAHAPNLADVKADAANNDNTRRSVRSAVLTSAAIVAAVALLGKSPGVYIVGGLTIVIEGFQFAHANTLSQVDAKPTTDIEAGGVLMAFPIGAGYTEAEWEQWFTAFTAANPKMPTYTGTNTKAKGKTWNQVYAVLAATAPKDTPDQVAEATIVLAEIEGVANGVGAVVTTVGNLPAISAESVTEGASQAANSIPGVSEASSIEGFLGALSSQNLWLRVTKVAVGSIMIIVGLLNITGAGKAATTVAKGAL